ncbi:MAG: response regulator, partial [Pseudomonadales bacterium]|nr:response regulator [Pseudomonadales bacterium]
RDAWRHFENPDHGIQLAVIDCTMPKMSGPEVYRKIREERIGIPVILVSGYHQDQVLDKISGDRHAYFIKKPFTVDDFLDLVNKSLNRQSPGAPSPHQTRQGE